MKRLLIAFMLVTLLTACQKTSTKHVKEYQGPAPGEVAFGFLAGKDEKQYLLEQNALFRSKLLYKDIEPVLKGEMLELNIPGNIAFSINSAKMTWNVHEILDKITPILKEYKHTSILVLGHSDSRGDRDLNQLLSEQRARAVRDYFINSGVDIRRITSRGLGAHDLLIQNDVTTLERALNRRVTLEIRVKKFEEEE
ncbi:MAG: OmpA family protein [Methyloprofundus sp.]|nr:OmpA family protein [Methyloprofundus sp.]